jgi:MFS family permease
LNSTDTLSDPNQCADLDNDISPSARHPEDTPDEALNENERSAWATISVLLLGVISSNAVASLVLATYATVSSDFDDLDSGSWLLSAYTLTMCATQPLYGKLSDIYGRKPLLLTAYAIFALGNLGAGLGQSLVQVIAWRAVQGVGGAGMASLVAIIIADIVPTDQVATFRGYVNISQVFGRSCGGVVGGWLTQAVGWRWYVPQKDPVVRA